VENLRLIGCPEETIRDIIGSELDKMYSERMLDELSSLDVQWWRSQPDEVRLAEQQQILQQLSRDRQTVLDSLLGTDSPVESVTEETDSLFVGGVLGELPDETKLQVSEIQNRLFAQEQAYLDDIESGVSQINPVRLAEIRYRAREELSAILTPEQLEEYLLRHSVNAEILRTELGSFEASPEEFRELFRLRDPLEQQIQLQTSSQDPAVTAGFSDKIVGIYQQALSPERYEEFLRSHDPQYQNAVAITQSSGLDSSAALPIYQIRQATEQERQAIENNPGLTDEQRQAALAALSEERQSMLRDLVGEENARLLQVQEAYIQGMMDIRSESTNSPVVP
jgi:hypothetical protein